ncbi:MAG: hypothetical protein LC737_11455 [Chloroflexi bacterium]|nr:hypothetical protein [Chloroflexota bacterium]
MSHYLLGNLLIGTGVLVWVVYFGLKLWQSYEGAVTPFLFTHLLFVVPGAFLAGRGWTRRVLNLFGSRADPDARDR